MGHPIFRQAEARSKLESQIPKSHFSSNQLCYCSLSTSSLPSPSGTNGEDLLTTSPSTSRKVSEAKVSASLEIGFVQQFQLLREAAQRGKLSSRLFKSQDKISRGESSHPFDRSASIPRGPSLKPYLLTPTTTRPPRYALRGAQRRSSRPRHGPPTAAPPPCPSVLRSSSAKPGDNTRSFSTWPNVSPSGRREENEQLLGWGPLVGKDQHATSQCPSPTR